MDPLTTVGIDLAKEVFAVCVLDVTGPVVERRVLRREAFMRWAERLTIKTVRKAASRWVSFMATS